MMKSLPAIVCGWVFVLSAVAGVPVYARRPPLKPTEFQPLTEAPGLPNAASIEADLQRIFRESNAAVRDAWLVEYLHAISSHDLAEAFDRCVELEGSQSPDELVELLLAIWAKRDPEACWARVEALFHLVAFEDGWLIYDGWKERPRMVIADPVALEKSSFWLEYPRTLAAFLSGVGLSSVSEAERVRWMKRFSERCFQSYSTWPTPNPVLTEKLYDHNRQQIATSAYQRQNGLRETRFQSDFAANELALRCWLKSDPSAAPEILDRVREMVAAHGRWEIPGPTSAQSLTRTLRSMGERGFGWNDPMGQCPRSRKGRICPRSACLFDEPGG